MQSFRNIFTYLVVFLTASCTYSGGIDNPFSKKFTWFSYINGDDIRKVCASLGADRYRFVYNGIYQIQTRTYDVFFHEKKVVMRVTGPSNIKQFDSLYIKNLYYNLMFSKLYNLDFYDFIFKNNFIYSHNLKIMINYFILIKRFYH